MCDFREMARVSFQKDRNILNIKIRNLALIMVFVRVYLWAYVFIMEINNIEILSAHMSLRAKEKALEKGDVCI